MAVCLFWQLYRKTWEVLIFFRCACLFWVWNPSCGPQCSPLAICSLLYIRASLHIELLFKISFGFCQLAQRVCDCARVTGRGVSVCVRAEEDLAGGSAQGMLLTQGEGDRAPPSHTTTICTASNAPSKCWWVSTWGWPRGEKTRCGSHESWGFGGGGQASSLGHTTY